MNDYTPEDLERERERLRTWEEKLRRRESELEEMVSEYPHLRAFAYEKLREHYEQTLPELPDKELETIMRENGAQPLEAFIEDIERGAPGGVA